MRFVVGVLYGQRPSTDRSSMPPDKHISEVAWRSGFVVVSLAFVIGSVYLGWADWLPTLHFWTRGAVPGTVVGENPFHRPFMLSVAVCAATLTALALFNRAWRAAAVAAVLFLGSMDLYSRRTAQGAPTAFHWGMMLVILVTVCVDVRRRIAASRASHAAPAQRVPVDRMKVFDRAANGDRDGHA